MVKPQAAPEQSIEAFAEHLSGDNAPRPQWIADEVTKLVNMEHGTRPFRSVRDGLGMQEGIEKINETAEGVEQGIYKAFQMDSMLEVKSPAKA